MPHIDLRKPTDEMSSEELLATVRELADQLFTVLNDGLDDLNMRPGGISLRKLQGDWAGNLNGKYKSAVTPAVADTEFEVTHQLGRIPSYWLVVSKDKACDVYRSKAFDATKCYFKCSVASANVTLLIW